MNNVNKDNQAADYQNMRMKALSGIISEKEWQDYCLKILAQKMLENQDVFIRLRDR